MELQYYRIKIIGTHKKIHRCFNLCFTLELFLLRISLESLHYSGYSPNRSITCFLSLEDYVTKADELKNGVWELNGPSLSYLAMLIAKKKREK